MSIVVTGATGSFGRLVVEDLLDRGVPADGIVATGRAVDRLGDLAERGVRVARLDYDDLATAAAVLQADDVLLLVSGSEPGDRVRQHGNVVRAAAEAGVARLAYTSILGAGDTSLVLAPEHEATEQVIRDSGVPATLLRNGWYTENYAPSLQQAAATGVLLGSAGDGRVASASRADFATAAATVLVEPGHEGHAYELSGDVAWDYDELAAAFAAILGRDVAYQRVDAEQHLAILTGAGLDEGTAGFLVALDRNTAEGALARTTGDLARLLGRPTTPLVEALRPLAPQAG